MNASNPDRIYVRLARKVPAESYGNYEVNLGYERDRLSSETPEKAIRNLESLVFNEFNRLLGVVEADQVKRKAKHG